MPVVAAIIACVLLTLCAYIHRYHGHFKANRFDGVGCMKYGPLIENGEVRQYAYNVLVHPQAGHPIVYMYTV